MGSGGPKWPQKPNNFKWQEMHSELSVGCFFTWQQVYFTANYATETSLFFFLFFGKRGGGQDPLDPPPKSDPVIHCIHQKI